MHDRLEIMPPVRRCAALFCVLAYLVGGIEVLPEFLALGAWFEGSHSVQMAFGSEGMTVVLSHQGIAPNEHSKHHHGPASRAICLLATPQTAADHVAQFRSRQLSESARHNLKAAPERPLYNAGVRLDAGAADTSAAFFFRAESRATQRPSDSLRSLRSTVLVI